MREFIRISNESLDSSAELVLAELEKGTKMSMTDLLGFLDGYDYHEELGRYLFWMLAENGLVNINANWKIEIRHVETN